MGPFTEQERRVFQFANPLTGKDQFADPWAVEGRLLTATNGELDALVEAVQPPPEGQTGNPVAKAQAESRLAAASRAAFGLSSFDTQTGQGATDQDALSVLAQYHDWLNRVFPNGGTGQTLPRTTGSQPGPLTPLNPLDCGCA